MTKEKLISESIYETYTKTLCINCKNRKLDLCNIRRNVKGNLQCCYYEKDKNIEGYKQQLCITAKQKKPIMKI